MQTFIMFGKYTADAVGKISAARTTQALDIVKKAGGEVKSSYALLGKPDIVVTVELPGIKEAVALSVTLTKTLGIAFTTAAAIPMDEFDKLASKT